MHDVAAQTATATATATPVAVAPCPSNLAITVSPPTAEWTYRVFVTVTPELRLRHPVRAVPPGYPTLAVLGDPQSFHLHYFLDIDPRATLRPGDRVPTGQPNTYPTEQLYWSIDANGQHTVYVVVSQFDARVCGVGGQLVVGSVTANFFVPPGRGGGDTPPAGTSATPATATSGAVPAPAKTGNAGLVEAGGTGAPWAANVLLLATLIGGARARGGVRRPSRLAASRRRVAGASLRARVRASTRVPRFRAMVRAGLPGRATSARRAGPVPEDRCPTHLRGEPGRAQSPRCPSSSPAC